MPDHVVTDEKGQVHRFPEEATPEMIAQALGVAPPTPVAPNPQTGQGMEQQAIQQSRQQMAAPVLQAAQEHEARQQLLAKRENRALKSPTPFSNAIAAYAPVTAARSIAGAKLGGAAGERIGGPWGSLIGGLVGGTAAAYTPGGITKAAQKITRGPGGTADVSVSPTTILSRKLESVIPRNPEPTDIPGQAGGALPASDEFYQNKGENILRRGVQEDAIARRQAATAKQDAKIPPWQTPTHEEIPLGSPDYPGPMSKIPGKAPAAARNVDPFTGEVKEVPLKVAVPRGAPTEPSEGRPATWDRKTVETLASWGDPDAMAQMQKRLPGGVGRAPLQFSSVETNPRSVTKFDAQGLPQGNPTPFEQQPARAPWETQGVNVTAPPLQHSVDMNGTRWVSDGSNKITLPPGFNGDIEAFARPKLAEQAQIRANMPWMKGPQ